MNKKHRHEEDIGKLSEILLCCKNGEKLLGVTDDKILLNFIV